MLKYVIVFLVLSLLVFSSCASPKETLKSCSLDTDCPSGVCNLLKADTGECAPTTCTPGDRTSTNHFFCNTSRQWQPSKQPGEPCISDYECFRQTCFMNPTCGLTDIPVVSCANSICKSEFVQNECEQQGLKKVLRKDQYNDECFESLAQHVLPTVCAPCGNGVCETGVESRCNCPEDCE